MSDKSFQHLLDFMARELIERVVTESDVHVDDNERVAAVCQDVLNTADINARLMELVHYHLGVAK